MLADLQELVKRRAVVAHFVAAELKAGHRDKLLGNLWHLIDPLSSMIVFYIVWSIVLGRRGPDFMAYLLSGIVTFEFFSSSVLSASVTLRTNARLIREVYFPKSVLPAATTFARLYDFGFAILALLLLLVALLYHQAHLSPEQMAKLTHPVSVGVNAVWLPVIVLVELMFCLGGAYLIAIVGAFFRDTTNVLTFSFRIWFYLSPLFYFPEDVPRKAFFIYRINPFTHFFQLFRGALIYDRPPTVHGMAYIAGLSLLTLFVGFYVFTKYEGTVIKQL